jgi:dolichyl-diphosphooligosaccharide--protein glycosyltransferase
VPRKSIWVGVALLGLFGVAFVLRASGFEWVFTDGDTVVFAPGDAQYHVRRSLYAWLNLPRVLLWDSYINYPEGAAISWPPLFDFTVAALARMFAGDETSFQVVAAWVPPVVGSLIVFPVYGIGRQLGSPGVGLGAAALIAAFPMSVTYSRVGQLDHHCAVALVGAWLLLISVRLVGQTAPVLRVGVALALARAAMMLTWHGSLLYLGVLEATLWLHAALAGRRVVYAVQAGSAMAALALVAPLVWLFPEPLGGPYSAIALSRLHVLAMLAVSLVAGGLWWLEGRAKAGQAPRTAKYRLVWTAALGLGVGSALLLLPGPREGIEPAIRFLTMTDGVGFRTGEQLPLFSIGGRPVGRPVWEVWGLFAYAIPLAPVAVLLSVPREKRAAAWVVAAWCAVFGLLSIVQRRYGNDFGPAAAVAFALALAEGGRRVAVRLWARPRLGPVLAWGLGLILLAPPIWIQTLPRAKSSAKALRGGYAGRDLAQATMAGTLTRFMEQVRSATPETSGYFDVSRIPEYGIVADPNLGHALQNVARRPTPTDPFWAFIGQENWDKAYRLLHARSEARALDLAEQLRARYVVTTSGADPSTLEGWLHHGDALASPGWAYGERFRLVTEAPQRGVPLAAIFRVRSRAERLDPGSSPYKLFEIVNGAVLEISAAPGRRVSATLSLETPTGRSLSYEASEVADANGLARLRVPYATVGRDEGEAVSARAPYQVDLGECIVSLHVTDAEVRSGAVITVPDGSDACSAAPKAS